MSLRTLKRRGDLIGNLSKYGFSSGSRRYAYAIYNERIASKHNIYQNVNIPTASERLEELKLRALDPSYNEHLIEGLNYNTMNEEYKKDVFVNDDVILPGRTNLNYPKGVTVSYRKKEEIKLTYLYPVLNMSDDEYKCWIREKKVEIIEGGHEFVESKWWKISRYECSLVDRDTSWWIKNVDKIFKRIN